MKEWKKLIRIGLVVLMLLSMMVPAAAAEPEMSVDLMAAPYVNYQEAVDVLTATGLLMDNFAADQPLTRGKAAQIICRLLLGRSVADNLPTSVAPFSDVPAGDPYAGYISYCAKENIIVGYRDGTFRPNNELAGHGFLKFLLSVLGYDAETEGFLDTNNGPFATVELAVQMGLTSGQKGDFEIIFVPTQEEACLYVLNTLKAQPVRYSQLSAEADPNYNSYAEVLFGTGNDALIWSCETNDYGLKEITYVFNGQTIGTYLADLQDTGSIEEADFAQILAEAAQAGLLDYFQPVEWDAEHAVTRLDISKLCAGFLEAKGAIDLDTYSPADISFKDTGSLTDVEKQIILAVIDAGILDGYTDGTFRPDGTFNRGMTTRILCNLLLGSTSAGQLPTNVNPFDDVLPYSVFSGYIAYCKSENIVYGDASNNFNPGSAADEKTVLEWFLRAQGIYVPTTLGGTFGSISWLLGKNGCLTISGSGAMPDCTQAPWLVYRDQIQEVVITDGITSVGKNAFASCTQLTAVELPESVTTISSRAFYQTALAEIALGSKIASIAADAFSGCPNTFLIRCFKDSAAEQYAKTQGIRFVTLDLADEVCIFAPSLPESEHLLLAVYDEMGRLRSIAFAIKDADQVLHFKVRNVSSDMKMRLIFLDGNYLPERTPMDAWTLRDA